MKLFASFVIGFFSWAEQEALSIALTEVKNGTTASFMNISIIIALATDVLYFNR